MGDKSGGTEWWASRGRSETKTKMMRGEMRCGWKVCGCEDADARGVVEASSSHWHG